MKKKKSLVEEAAKFVLFQTSMFLNALDIDADDRSLALKGLASLILQCKDSITEEGLKGLSTEDFKAEDQRAVESMIFQRALTATVLQIIRLTIEDEKKKNNKTIKQ